MSPAGTTAPPARNGLLMVGASDTIRTRDLSITNALLYQLSYAGMIHLGCVRTR